MFFKYIKNLFIKNENKKENLKEKSKALKFIFKHHTALSFFFYLLSFLIFGLLISEFFCEKTYFSDNALLPGFVNRNFDLKQQTDNNLEDLKRLKSIDLPTDWLLKKFKNLGLEVYSQSFELNYPFGKKHNITGNNIYAILRGPRSIGTEALVLSSSYINNKTKTTLPGIALLLSLAEYFSSKNYWSKDLIFLIYEHDLIGCEAWIKAYFDSNEENSNFLKSQSLISKSGSIIAAINLEITTTIATSLDIKIEGLNGQLTNLDLFNVVVEIGTRENIHVSFHQLAHIFTADYYESWIEYSKTIGNMMMTQASTFTNGAHGLFQKHAIQSLTLATIKDEEDLNYIQVSFFQFGKVIEGVIRSCNNLVERFNRSYWFYLLPSTRRYVSIAFYMVPIAFLISPLLLKALVVYFDLLEEFKMSVDIFYNVLPIFFVTYLFGSVIAAFPFMLENFSKTQSNLKLETQDVIFYSLVTFVLASMFNPLISKNSNKQKNLIQRYLVYINLALLLSCLSLVNISLALFSAILYVPVMISLPNYFKPISKKQKARVFFHKILLVLINPLIVIFLTELSLSFYFRPEQFLIDHLIKSFIAQKKTILNLVENWYFFGNWTYLIGSVFFLPLWLQIWYLF